MRSLINHGETAEAFLSQAQEHLKEAQSHIMSHKTADGQCTQEMYTAAPAVFTCNTFTQYTSWNIITKSSRK